jgi:hypothetical protein
MILPSTKGLELLPVKPHVRPFRLDFRAGGLPLSLIEQVGMCDTRVLFCLSNSLSAQAITHEEVHGGTVTLETQLSLARRVVAEMEAPPVILPCAQRTGQDRCASQCGETANTNIAKQDAMGFQFSSPSVFYSQIHALDGLRHH